MIQMPEVFARRDEGFGAHSQRAVVEVCNR